MNKNESMNAFCQEVTIISLSRLCLLPISYNARGNRKKTQPPPSPHHVQKGVLLSINACFFSSLIFHLLSYNLLLSLLYGEIPGLAKY